MKKEPRIRIWLRVALSMLLAFRGTRAKILDEKDTVEQILKGKSLIRLGDGEFRIMRGLDIGYQPYSPALGEEFKKIKDSFERAPEDCPYVLAVPKKFLEASGFSLMKKRVYVSSWAEARLYFKRHFSKTPTYADAFLFNSAAAGIYEKIWLSDERAVIFVHNDELYKERFAERYGKRVHFVKCPSRDAYSAIDEIETGVLEIIRKNSYTEADVTLTVSAGPAGKVLVSRFSHRGFLAIDAGHCWDTPLEEMK